MYAAHSSGDNGRAETAEHAALGLARYLSDAENHALLMDVQGENSSTLGEVNPLLTGSLADGLHGYIPELVGADRTGAWQEGDLEPVESFEHAQRIFTLMATDAGASETFGSAATTFGQHFAGEFVRSDEFVHAAYSGRMQALLDTGIYNAAAEQFDDRQRIDEYMQQRRADAYNTNFSIARNIVALHPFTSGTIGLTMDLHNTGWRDAVVPTADPEARDPFLIDAARYRSETGYQLLEQAVALHGMPQDPNDVGQLEGLNLIGSDGDLRPPEADLSYIESADVFRHVVAHSYGIAPRDFDDFFQMGYSQVAPTIAFPGEPGPR